MDPVYCRKCRAGIDSSFTHCPHCGWDQRNLYIAPTADASSPIPPVRTASGEEEVQRQQAEFEARQSQHAAAIEARKQAIYNTATGKGVCPNCKSPNVRQYSVREGGNTAGANMACCLGCMVSPLAWILLPFMGGKKAQECQCQYCSFKWRL